MAQIALTPEFFRKEILNYSRFSTAFWREMLQNSIDAGATHIDVTLQDMDTAVKVKFADNGRGMSRDVLEDVFFALGRTTKGTTGTIGGFGKARIVTCFGMDSYTIRTGSVHVEGAGAEYDIAECDSAVRGATFEIVVPTQELHTNLSDFTRALLDYLTLCQIDCDIRINGVRWTTWTYRRKLVRRLTFADVHVNKSAPYSLQNRMLVRVGGVLMYEKYIAADVLIVVEVTPSLSRDVLLSNRDRLHYSFENELEKFAQEVAVNTTSALTTTTVVKQVLPGEARTFVPKGEKPKFFTQPARVQQAVSAPTYAVSSEYIPRAEEVGESREAMSAEELGLGGDDEDEGYTDPITEGMVFTNESSDPRVRKAAALYHPSKWGDGKGTRRRKLLAQWVIACEYALEEFCLLTGHSAVKWRWGWLFSDVARAQCESQTDGSYALTFNPIHGADSGADSSKDVGTMCFAIREFESHVSLVMLACHEVTHIKADSHDEEFSTLFTQIGSRVFKNIRKIHQEMISA